MEKNDSVRRMVTCFRANKDAIQTSWRDRIVTDPEVPTAQLTELELADHVPQLLDQIVEALEGFAAWRDEAETRGEAAGRGPAAKRHIKMRARQGYDLAQVLRELHHLREAVIDVCEGQLVHVGGDPARVVHAAIDAAMMLAAENREDSTATDGALSAKS